MLVLLKNNRVKFKNGQIFGQYQQITNYYNLVVNNGLGDGVYPSGTIVNISGELSGDFLYWSGDTSTIDNISGEFTTITMLDNYIITANYNEPQPINTETWSDDQNEYDGNWR